MSTYVDYVSKIFDPHSASGFVSGVKSGALAMNKQQSFTQISAAFKSKLTICDLMLTEVTSAQPVVFSNSTVNLDEKKKKLLDKIGYVVGSHPLTESSLCTTIAIGLGLNSDVFRLSILYLIYKAQLDSASMNELQESVNYIINKPETGRPPEKMFSLIAVLLGIPVAVYKQGNNPHYAHVIEYLPFEKRNHAKLWLMECTRNTVTYCPLLFHNDTGNVLGKLPDIDYFLTGPDNSRVLLQLHGSKLKENIPTKREVSVAKLPARLSQRIAVQRSVSTRNVPSSSKGKRVLPVLCGESQSGGRVHKEKRPMHFVCGETIINGDKGTCNCRYSFKQKGHLLRHLKKGYPFKCSIVTCQLTFKEKSDLRRHVNGFHKERGIYDCIYCNENFMWRSYLVRHFRKMHPGMDMPPGKQRNTEIH